MDFSLRISFCLFTAAFGMTVSHGMSFMGKEGLQRDVERPLYWDDEWHPILGPRSDSNWTNRLLVWPSQKFAFCWIEKNAGTEFSILMNNLTGAAVDETVGNSMGYFSSSWANLGDSDIIPEKISRANGWRLGIFVRDPAERLLSAWSSKCQAWENGGRNCLGRKQVPNDLSEEAVNNFESMVRDLLPKYMAERRERGYFNAHYDPQSTFCGAKEATAYNFIGHLSGQSDEVHDQVADMLCSVAHVPPQHAIWSILPTIFPRQFAAGHHTDAGARMTAFYRSPDVRAAVAREYAADYGGGWGLPVNFGQ